MHEIFFIKMNSPFNFMCKLSYLRQLMHINSCLIHFSLACFPWQQYSSHMISLSNLRLCNNISCLILITFTCHMNPITSWTSLLERFEPSYQPWIPCSQFSFYNFACHFWVPHELTSFNTLELSYQTWIPCSSIFHSHSSLSHIMIANGTCTIACNTWAISIYINSQIKYMLMISCKQISHLIVLSINTPKPTRGLDALSHPATHN